MRGQMLLVTLLALAMTTLVQAAGKADKDVAKEKVPATFEELLAMPQPEGGMEALAKAVAYPETAKEDGLEGEVRLQLAIDAAGKVGDVTVLQAVRADLDSAAVRAVRAVPWKAARGAEGQLPCTVVVPIKFKLGDKPKS